MWWKSNHMSSPCCKFAFSRPSVASQSTSAIPDKFKCTNLVFCWFFSLTILSWCRFVNRRFGLYINTACGIFFSNFKHLATMTKIRPAVQISLESLYHHVKLFSQFSGKFVQTNIGNHILHLHSSGTDILVEGPFFSFRNTKRSYFEVYLIKRSQRNLLKRGRRGNLLKRGGRNLLKRSQRNQSQAKQRGNRERERGGGRGGERKARKKRDKLIIPWYGYVGKI